MPEFILFFRRSGMKHSMLRKIITFSILLLFLSVAFGIAQEQEKDKDQDPQRNPDGTYTSEKYDEAERPEDSYLAKFHAQDVVQKLSKRNLEQIYLLKVIVSNFPDKGWKEEYDKVYDGYKDAMEFYYKRNIIYARVEFENNRKAIRDLMQKIADDYKKETNDLLAQCAEEILELHLKATTLSDPNKSRELERNQMRLRVGYGQYDDAISAIIDKKFETAIYHFRVAKGYGINILEELAAPEKRKEISEKYKYHKADNLNRIYDKEKRDQAPSNENQPQ